MFVYYNCTHSKIGTNACNFIGWQNIPQPKKKINSNVFTIIFIPFPNPYACSTLMNICQMKRKKNTIVDIIEKTFSFDKSLLNKNAAWHNMLIFLWIFPPIFNRTISMTHHDCKLWYDYTFQLQNAVFGLGSVHCKWHFQTRKIHLHLLMGMCISWGLYCGEFTSESINNSHKFLNTEKIF